MGGFVIAICMLLCSDLASFAANKNDCAAVTWTSTGIVISKPGVYCLTADIDTGPEFTTGTAISINAPNVTLDLGSHTISNLGAGRGTKAIGIAAQGQVRVVVRNGTLDGFYRAIQFVQNSGQIEDIRSDSAAEFAIYVSGPGTVVRHNYILHAGGTPAGNSGGIRGVGNELRILDNDIVDFKIVVGSYGILVEGGTTGIVIEGNRISNKPMPEVSNYNGIFILAYALVANNRITGVTNGVTMAGGKYRDNLTSGTTRPYFCQAFNAGNNE
jgi:hypothetical protein